MCIQLSITDLVVFNEEEDGELKNYHPHHHLSSLLLYDTLYLKGCCFVYPLGLRQSWNIFVWVMTSKFVYLFSSIAHLTEIHSTLLLQRSNIIHFTKIWDKIVTTSAKKNNETGNQTNPDAANWVHLFSRS